VNSTTMGISDAMGPMVSGVFYDKMMKSSRILVFVSLLVDFCSCPMWLASTVFHGSSWAIPHRPSPLAIDVTIRRSNFAQSTRHKMLMNGFCEITARRCRR
jgi:hypothetical protein